MIGEQTIGLTRETVYRPERANALNARSSRLTSGSASPVLPQR